MAAEGFLFKEFDTSDIIELLVATSGLNLHELLITYIQSFFD